MMNLGISAASVAGLPAKEQKMLSKLIETFERHAAANATKNRYYEGKISLGEVNLGIALPQGVVGLQIGCAWGAKCVDVLAVRSMFDGFVNESGQGIDLLDRLVQDNRLVAEYQKATRDELKLGCDFATLSADPDIGCKIRFHSPATAAAIWDGNKGRIAYGMAVIDAAQDNTDNTWAPNLIHLYTDDAVWVLKRVENQWKAEHNQNKMGRPLMEPIVWNATSDKPFGRSRIKEPIRRLIQGYVRTIANATIGLEFATSPQKYLLGITDEQYDAVISNKFKQYVGNILAATANPETGEKPSFGQLSQGTISPHVEMLRTLAAQFAAATGLTTTDIGVVSEANPTSSDAILAQSRTLVAMAEQLNSGNGDSLRTIALMALAIAQDKTMEELPAEQLGIMAHFKNPSMPSIASMADAAIKIASARPNFANTDTFLEMIGFSPADIRRIDNQEMRSRGLALVGEFET